MATFFASCPTGMADLVEKELQSFGLKTYEKTIGGVIFESNWAGCYKANLKSRYASRILKPILDFPAYQNEDIYNNILIILSNGRKRFAIWSLKFSEFF